MLKLDTTKNGDYDKTLYHKKISAVTIYVIIWLFMK